VLCHKPEEAIPFEAWALEYTNDMTPISPWVQRRFNFDFPVSLYPNILARFRGTPARLEEAVRSLWREQLIVKPDGKWSIQENAGHLLDAETLFRTRLTGYLAGAESLTAAPYASVELKHNNEAIESILERFRHARDENVAELASLRPDDFASAAWHGRLQVNMRLVDHLFFFAEHDDHHLARIWELRAAPLAATR
jgi:uncharacterized damage-inducible protein DinB